MNCIMIAIVSKLWFQLIFLRHDLQDSQDIFYSFVPEEQKNEESAIAEVNTSILWNALIYNSTSFAYEIFTVFFRQRRIAFHQILPESGETTQTSSRS